MIQSSHHLEEYIHQHLNFDPEAHEITSVVLFHLIDRLRNNGLITFSV